jgi:misacylated tRNA(Ala) deacylase
VLDDSVLYPEGGGQPWDFGFVAGMKVEKVVKGPTNKQVLVELTSPLEEGTEVTCSVDWTRRYDFMQQHTAQVSVFCIFCTTVVHV